MNDPCKRNVINVTTGRQMHSQMYAFSSQFRMQNMLIRTAPTIYMPRPFLFNRRRGLYLIITTRLSDFIYDKE